MLNLLFGLLIAWMAVFAHFEGQPPTAAVIVAGGLSSYGFAMAWLFRR